MKIISIEDFAKGVVLGIAIGFIAQILAVIIYSHFK